MPQSLSTVLVHLVFSTKNRESFITPTVEAELHPYMATVFRDHNSPSLAINGTADHIHALFILSRTITIADVVEKVKTGSSKWLKTKGPEFRDSIGKGATEHFQSANQPLPNSNATSEIRNNITARSVFRTSIES